jgi:hypothetical protein
MEDIIDLIAQDSSASDVRDAIQNVLYAKAAERVDLARPLVAQSMFGEQEADSEFEEGEELDDEETYEDEDEE